MSDKIMCESCGKVEATEERKTAKTWHYCKVCAEAHDKESGVNSTLKLLMQTHPEAVNRLDVVKAVRSGISLEEIKKSLDMNKQPSLEAEVVL